jgi:hypothetical protein
MRQPFGGEAINSIFGNRSGRQGFSEKPVSSSCAM